MSLGKQIFELVGADEQLPTVSQEDAPLIQRFLEETEGKLNEFGNKILEGAKLMDLDTPEEDCIKESAALCITPVSWGKLNEEIRAQILENKPEEAENPKDSDTFLRVTLNTTNFVDFIYENTPTGYTKEEQLKLMIFFHHNLREHANQVSPFIAMKLQVLKNATEIAEMPGACECGECVTTGEEA